MKYEIKTLYRKTKFLRNLKKNLIIFFKTDLNSKMEFTLLTLLKKNSIPQSYNKKAKGPSI